MIGPSGTLYGDCASSASASTIQHPLVHPVEAATLASSWHTVDRRQAPRGVAGSLRPAHLQTGLRAGSSRCRHSRFKTDSAHATCPWLFGCTAPSGTLSNTLPHGQSLAAGWADLAAGITGIPRSEGARPLGAAQQTVNMRILGEQTLAEELRQAWHLTGEPA